DLPSMEEQREETILHLEDALRPVGVPVLAGNETLQAAIAASDSLGGGPILVRFWDGSWYAAKPEEITAAAATMTADTPLQQALGKDRVPILFPDLPLDSALPYFPRWPLL